MSATSQEIRGQASALKKAVNSRNKVGKRLRNRKVPLWNFLLQTRIGCVVGPPPMAGLEWRLRRPQPPVPRRGRFQVLGLVRRKHQGRLFASPADLQQAPQDRFPEIVFGLDETRLKHC